MAYKMKNYEGFTPPHLEISHSEEQNQPSTHKLDSEFDFQPVEKAIDGKFYVPRGPRAGLLMYTLSVNHLDFIARQHKEDFYQEAAVFLLEANDLDDHEFMKAAARHFYKMAKDYGYRRPKGAIAYETNIDQTDLQFQDGDERENVLERASGQHATNNIDTTYIAKAHEMVAEALSPEELELLDAYLCGYPTGEIANIYKQDAASLPQQIKTIMKKVRVYWGVETNMPLPGVGAPKQSDETPPDQNTRKHVPLPYKEINNIPLPLLMQLLGVSRATAHRIRRRKYFSPGYHQTTEQ